MTDNRPEPRTEAGRRMLRRRSYWSGNDDIRAAILAIEAEAAQEAAPLADAASEMLLWIDTYDDAMGHGYCAMQSGDYTDSCTCGFTEKRERWKAAIEGAAPRAEGPERRALIDIMGMAVDHLDDPRLRIIHKVAQRAVDDRSLSRPSDEGVPEPRTFASPAEGRTRSDRRARGERLTDDR